MSSPFKQSTRPLVDNKDLEELSISDNAKMDETLFGEHGKNQSSEIGQKERGTCKSIVVMDKTHCAERPNTISRAETRNKSFVKPIRSVMILK